MSQPCVGRDGLFAPMCYARRLKSAEKAGKGFSGAEIDSVSRKIELRFSLRIRCVAACSQAWRVPPHEDIASSKEPFSTSAMRTFEDVPILENERHELFAQELAKGKTAVLSCGYLEG